MPSPHPPTRFLRRSAGLAAAAALAAVLAGAPQAAAHENTPPATDPTTASVPGEKALLGRLVAPCCWNQTLDIHGGGVPDQLRAEIRRRLIAGESPEAIEADFVARYGPAVLSVQPSSPLSTVLLGVGGLALAAGVGVFMKMRRWKKAGDAAQRAAPKASREPAAPDAYDEKLDAELRALD